MEYEGLNCPLQEIERGFVKGGEWLEFWSQSFGVDG